MPAYYLLVPAGDPLREPFLRDQAGAPPRITATPRRLPVSEIIDEDPVTALLGRAHQLVTVAPLGPVTATAAGFAACAGGWAETARSRDLGPVTGPQHAAIVSLITEAARLFTSPGEDSLRAAGAYAGWETDRDLSRHLLGRYLQDLRSLRPCPCRDRFPSSWRMAEG